MKFLVCLLVMICPLMADAQVRYGRHIYSSRVCNSPYCEMCNRIEDGLRAQRERIMPSTAYFSVPDKVVKTLPAHNPLADTTLEPSPQEAVDAMLQLVAPKATELLLDIGCGDGRILLAAAKGYGAQTVGIELNPESAKLARTNAWNAGVTDRVLVLQRDVLDLQTIDADIVTMFLFPELIEAIWPKITEGTRVVSLWHPLPAIANARQVKQGEFTFFLAIK